ncbi:hypothetical protein [Sneathiella sp.]|uniref:Acg family FMN-binding oxidoreductase n=1 Tax=Sneathiella sp. TaxID=1964365 RepID=UPI002620E592|nr:hypothetical protein [Sneathiella sp.]MDF2365855.1 hypothetical protein [Sneathiella sp.]
MDRRGFIKTIGGSGLVIAASGLSLTGCDQMPQSAVAPWDGPAPTLPDREWMLGYAILAPNPHNRQPWLADLSKANEITLFADPERLLPHTDPFGRQILIGHGTFLELLDIAARERGYRTEIILFPDGEPAGDSLEIGDKPVARIQLEKDAAIPSDPLFKDILTRRSNKESYQEAYLTATDKEIIQSLPLLSGQRSGVATSEADVSPLREFARIAVLKEIETPRTLLESVELTRIGADEIAQNPDGIDLHGPLFWWLKRFGLMSHEKAITPGTIAYQGGVDYAMGWVDGTYNMGWLVTSDNSRSAQVNAGRSYVRLNLMATNAGIAIHPVSQVLQEYPEMHDIQTAFLEHLGIKTPETVQMFYRLGYQSDVSPSPRRRMPDIVMS